MKTSILLTGLVLVFGLSSPAFASHLPPQEKSLGADYVRLSNCVPEHGVHWAKNPGRFGPPGTEKNPELLYYKGRLVAVEYVIPARIAQKEPPRQAMHGPEMHIGNNLHEGESTIDHVDLAYLPVFPPDKKDGFKAFTVHLWLVDHGGHEKFCK